MSLSQLEGNKVTLEDYQLKEDQTLETESKEVVGGINEVYGELIKKGIKIIEGVKELAVSEALENGIYYIPDNITIKMYADNEIVDDFVGIGGCFLLKNDTQFFALANEKIYCGLFTGKYSPYLAGSKIANLVTTTGTAKISGAYTFLNQPQMTATLKAKDNSTNIPTTAWVQNELANLGSNGGGTKLYKHFMKFNIHYTMEETVETENGAENILVPYSKEFTIYFLSTDNTPIEIIHEAKAFNGQLINGIDWYKLPANAVLLLNESGILRGAFTDRYFDFYYEDTNSLVNTHHTTMFCYFQEFWQIEGNGDTTRLEMLATGVEEI